MFCWNVSELLSFITFILLERKMRSITWSSHVPNSFHVALKVLPGLSGTTRFTMSLSMNTVILIFLALIIIACLGIGTVYHSG
jgi:hypothetical protein